MKSMLVLIVASMGVAFAFAEDAPDEFPPDLSLIGPQTHLPAAAASTVVVESTEIYNSTTASDPTATPTTYPSIETETKELAKRLADLFICLPGIKSDKDYGTQSWHVVDTFQGWNNSIAKSNLPKELKYDAKLKALFVETAMARVKARNASLADNATLKAYFENAASEAESIFNSAVSERTTYNDFKGASDMVTKSHAAGADNIFKKLKPAHSATVEKLYSEVCIGVKPTFWNSPHFAFPGNEESAKATREAAKVDLKKGSKSTKTANAKGTAGNSTHGEPAKLSDRPAEVEKSIADIEDNREFNRAIDAKYGKSKKISAQLPFKKESEKDDLGYFTYYRSDRLWGRPQSVGSIIKAAHALKKQGIYMGVGDINEEPGRNPYDKKTPGHNSHNNGRAVDLRFIGKSGDAFQCDNWQYCKNYDRQKTFEMVKALIDSDPYNVSVIYINDPVLEQWVQKYFRTAYNYSWANAAYRVQDHSNHDNHIHFHWKD